MLEVLAIGGMIVLAARAYERAILRIGAPVKLHRLFALRSSQMHPVSTAVRQTSSTSTVAAEQEPGPPSQPRLSPRADKALRIGAAVLLIAAVVVGVDKPIAVPLIAVATLLVIIDQTLKHLPRRPVH